MKVKVYDYKGKVDKEIDLGSALKDVSVDNSLLSQYIRVFQTNQRQGTVRTKTKAEVSGGGKKPWRQKGTGRARAGSIRSPLWVGGGIAHGPKPRDWDLKLNKKTTSLLFKYLVSNVISEDILSIFTYSGEGYSTKAAVEFLKAIKVSPETSTLIIHNQDNDNLYKSFRNIKNIRVVNINELNNYDILSSENILLENGSLDILKERLSK